jgi:N-acetyl-alpha-D-glucosaminyl L-malate synthase BshA
MKIAILVGAFPPKWLAGIEIATYNIAKQLAKRGHEVHVITTLDEGLPKETIEDRFCVHRIFCRKIRFLGIISFWIKIFWHLKKIDPDIAHVQSVGSGIPGFLAKKLFKKPYIVWGHGSDIYLPDKFTKSISKLVLKNADAVIALTEDMKKKIQKICDRDVVVVPNGIDLERFNNLSKGDIRKRLKIKDDKKRIIFVGTLRPVKSVKYLIKAIKIIIQKDINTRLMLVGDGDERGNLEKLVKELSLEEYVKFVGKVPNEEVPEYMAVSDVFVLPSLSESFGIVNLEAMASGLPIVATKVGGLPEIIKDGENGFLVEPKNPEELAEKVLSILGNNELRERITRNNKEKAKDYSWESVVEKLEEVYRNHL